MPRPRIDEDDWLEGLVPPDETPAERKRRRDRERHHANKKRIQRRKRRYYVRNRKQILKKQKRFNGSPRGRQYLHDYRRSEGYRAADRARWKVRVKNPGFKAKRRRQRIARLLCSTEGYFLFGSTAT
jgi:hypothetical protein